MTLLDKPPLVYSSYILMSYQVNVEIKVYTPLQ